MSRSEQVLAQTTLAEKASPISGENLWIATPIDRLGAPSIMLTDGPHGLRKQVDEAPASRPPQSR
ncbi:MULTISPECIES: hypothetical protein [unclassified Leucobacter]|uniref:hypothetical protein n=1 Tax=unclassified Leucobacter TaxID=2621730 RepID=UPI00165EBBD4|nr:MULTISPECIES: hypothetical protein [unclassified Leucobacter]MBC9935456.1 hypothetical protein [Leucobacter sp. cx-87]